MSAVMSTVMSTGLCLVYYIKDQCYTTETEAYPTVLRLLSCRVPPLVTVLLTRLLGGRFGMSCPKITGLATHSVSLAVSCASLRSAIVL